MSATLVKPVLTRGTVREQATLKLNPTRVWGTESTQGPVESTETVKSDLPRMRESLAVDSLRIKNMPYQESDLTFQEIITDKLQRKTSNFRLIFNAVRSIQAAPSEDCDTQRVYVNQFISYLQTMGLVVDGRQVDRVYSMYEETPGSGMLYQDFWMMVNSLPPKDVSDFRQTTATVMARVEMTDNTEFSPLASK
eukprot:gene11975-2187_t